MSLSHCDHMVTVRRFSTRYLGGGGGGWGSARGVMDGISSQYVQVPKPVHPNMSLDFPIGSVDSLLRRAQEDPRMLAPFADFQALNAAGVVDLTYIHNRLHRLLASPRALFRVRPTASLCCFHHSIPAAAVAVVAASH